MHCSSGGLTDPLLGTQPITGASPAPNIGLNPWPPFQHAFLLPARTWNRLITRGGVSNALSLSRLGVPRPLLSGEQGLQAPSPARLLSESPKATLWEPLCGHLLPLCRLWLVLSLVTLDASTGWKKLVQNFACPRPALDSLQRVDAMQRTWEQRTPPHPGLLPTTEKFQPRSGPPQTC